MTHPHISRLKMPTLRQRGHFYSIPRSIRNRLEERGNRASQESPGSIEVWDHTSMGTRRNPPASTAAGPAASRESSTDWGTPSPPPNASPGKAPGPAAGLGQPQPSPGLQEIDRLPSPIVAYPPAEKAAERCGLSLQFFASVETGGKNVRAESLAKLAEGLEVSADQLLLGRVTDFDLARDLQCLKRLNEEEYQRLMTVMEQFFWALDLPPKDG